MISALIIVAWTAYQGAISWQHARAFSLGSDQVIIATMAQKLNRTELYATDQVFRDPSVINYYMPVFLWIVAALRANLGSFDFAFAALSPLLILPSVIAMTLLIRQLTSLPLLPVLIALFSSLSFYPIGSEIWGSVGLYAALPRTVFSVLATAIFAILLASSKFDAKRFALAGLVTGLGANLHAVSALHLVQILVILAIFIGSVTLAQRVSAIAMTVGATGIGALPILVSFGRSDAAAPHGGEWAFAMFAEAIAARLPNIYPFTVETGLSPTTVVVGTATYTVVCLGLLLVNPRPSPKLAFLAIMQLPFTYLIVVSRGQLIGIALVATAIVYALLLSRRESTFVDEIAVISLAAAVIVTFVGSFVLSTIWQALELESLTILMVEEARAGRMVYLPLFIMLTRVISDALSRVSRERQLVLVGGAVGTLVAAVLVRDWVIHGVGRVPAAKSDLIELSHWAREATSLNSLFLFSSPEFRLRSERSITHSWKDVGVAYPTRRLLVPLWLRFKELDEMDLADAAARTDADYVVVDSPGMPLAGSKQVFANGSYVVYARHG